jgi:hypothetical protein
MRILITIVLTAGALAAAIWVYFAIAESPSSGEVLRMLARQDECVQLLTQMRQTGLVKNAVKLSAGDVAAYVDEAKWVIQTTEARLNLTWGIYCAMAPPSGRLTVTVLNMRGEAIFRIKNGKVAPW